jgi:ribosomal protein L11 methyltransferase
MRSVVVSATLGEAEVASDVLWSLGVVAIEERRCADDLVELWTSVGDDDAALDAVADALGPRWQWRIVDVDERVADSWREHAGAVEVSDDLLVVPAWRDDLVVDVPPGRMVLSIEPGSTFGLGDHPTTRGCLLALRRELACRPPTSVLDVGCGSGILAVAAARSGAGRVVAVDIAAAAVPTTLDNARRNGVAATVDVSTTPLHAVTGRYGVVVANILAPALIELADELRAHLDDGGALIISGVLAERFDHVLAALEPLVPTRIDVIDGWATVTLGLESLTG